VHQRQPAESDHLAKALRLRPLLAGRSPGMNQLADGKAVKGIDRGEIGLLKSIIVPEYRSTNIDLMLPTTVLARNA
jgi:hypothetical protein